MWRPVGGSGSKRRGSEKGRSMPEQGSTRSVTQVAPAEGSSPHISVVIATRNRPADLERCLNSLSCVRYPTWDLLLLDQSDDMRSCEVADRFVLHLPALQYVRTESRGLSRARNIGLCETKGAVVAFLDDDCTVDPDWLNQIARAFAQHEEADLVFGALKNALVDSKELLVPAFEVADDV